MDERLCSLSEREKEALRLLLAGHDAKSAAQAMGLSVHTVNERLRDARRKLGTTSSREAARLLAQNELTVPNFLGNMEIRVAANGTHRKREPSHQNQGGGRPFTWLIGGMAIMLVILTAVYVAATLPSDGAIPTAADPIAISGRTTTSDKAGVESAQAWAEYLDEQRWAESWAQSGSTFRSSITQAGWISTIQPLRQRLGGVSSRTVRSVSSTTSLPGAPKGEYKIVQFTTDFASKRDATETVVLARDGSAWKVNGYFIR